MQKRLIHRARPRRRRSRYEYWAVAFAAVVVALAVAAVLFSVGRVRVVVSAAALPIATDFDVTVVASGTPGEREIAGRLVRVDGTASVTRPLGQRDGARTLEALPSAKATGTVTLVNTHSVTQPLVATTRLLTEGGVLFRIDRNVVVPARGKLEDVAVTADAPGVHGNVAPSRFRIPGLSSWLQERIWAESYAPMTGGQGPPAGGAPAGAGIVVVTQEDVDAVRTAAEAQARADLAARAEALAGSTEDAVVLEAVVTAASTGAVGELLNAVSATATASADVLVVPRGALWDRTHLALTEAAAVQGRELRSIREDATVVRLVAADASTGRVTVAVHAEGDAHIAPSFASFDARRITGFSAEDVRTYLRSIPGVEQVEVELWPAWVKKVPSNGRVDVEVHELAP